MSNAQLKTVETFFNLIHLPSQTAAINAALRLGIVDALTTGQLTAKQIAAQCGLQERGTAALLVVLTEIGLVERFDQDFALSQAARMIPKSVWGSLFQQWMALEQSLRSTVGENQESNGSPSGVSGEKSQHHDADSSLFKQFLAQTEWSSTPAALKVADALGVGSERSNLRVLNLSCGAAIYSMTIAHRDSGAHITLVDDPAGLARARSTVENLELTNRVVEIQSDLLVPNGVDGPFDLILIADRVHLLNAEACRRLFRDAYQLLVAGGELALVDLFSGQDRGQLATSVQELLLSMAAGRNSHTLQSLDPWLVAVGFVNIQFTHLPAPPFTRGLLLATKP